MMGSKHAAHASSVRLRSLLWMSSLLLVWFTSSIVSTLINKMLMTHFPYPVTISFVHMLSSVVVDLFIVLSRGLSLRPFRLDIFWQCLPVAATINFGQSASQRAVHPTSHPHSPICHQPLSLTSLVAPVCGRVCSSMLLHQQARHSRISGQP